MAQASLEQGADGTWVLTFVVADDGTVLYRNKPTTSPGAGANTPAVNVSGWSTKHHINDRWKTVTESTGACTVR